MMNPINWATLARSGTATALLIAAVTGCGPHQPLGPPIPEGATIIPGPDNSDLAPPPGWKEHLVVPASQQQAQDTILGYLKKTLAALPAGIALDATRYGGATNTVGCNDDDTSLGAPQEFSTIGELNLPTGVDPLDIVAQAGNIWKSWGWYVVERDGFRKPNRFGYAPDGYSLQIKAKTPTNYPPTLIGVSPCFPGDVPKGLTPFPMIVTGE